MKKSIKSLVGLSFLFFIGGSALSQESSNGELKPITFKTQAEKDAWIENNPTEYAKMKAEASQVSATYLGSLLQIRTDVQSISPEGQGKAPAGKPSAPELEGFPVKKNTGNAKADQLRYEEAKEEWYERNKKK